MTNDILNSIKATLYDRISNPLLGAFFVSWAFINYRLIWVLFSPASFSEKFRYIDEVLLPKPEYYAGYFILAPAAAAWFYLYLLPKLGHRVYKHYQTKQKELKEIKQSIDDETPLTKEESRKIRAEVRVLESTHQDEIKSITDSYKSQSMEYAEMSEEVAALRKKLETKINENNNLFKELDKEMNNHSKSNMELIDEKSRIEKKNKSSHQTNSGFSDVDLKIIELLAHVKEEISLEELFSSLNIPRIKFDVLIEDLKDEDLVSTITDSDNGREYLYLTTAGKRFAIERNFI